MTAALDVPAPIVRGIRLRNQCAEVTLALVAAGTDGEPVVSTTAQFQRSSDGAERQQPAAIELTLEGVPASVCKVSLFAQCEPPLCFRNSGAGSVLVTEPASGTELFDFDLVFDFGNETAVKLFEISRSGSGWVTVPVGAPIRPPVSGCLDLSSMRTASCVPEEQVQKKEAPQPQQAPIVTTSPQPAPRWRSASVLGGSIALCGVALMVWLLATSIPPVLSPPQRTAASTETPVPAADASATAAILLGADRLSDSAALESLYGQFDHRLNGVVWTPTELPPKYASLADKRMLVRAAMFAGFVQAGVSKQLLLTTTSDIVEGSVVEPGQGCHGCQVLVGAAVFARQGAGWTLESVERFLSLDGSWGAPPRFSAEMTASNDVVIHFSASDMAQGQISTWTYEARYKSGQWSVSDPIIEETRPNEPEQETTSQATSPVATTSSVEAPSFDCRAAESASEKAICSDADLARHDRELAEMYARALRATDDPAKLRAEGVRAWREREKTCSTRSCLLEWYSQRRTDMLRILKDAPSEPRQGADSKTDGQI